MTLDRVSLHTIKGHFCSLLVSNIFCYARFRYFPALHLRTFHLTRIIDFSSENTPCIWCFYCSRAEGAAFSDPFSVRVSVLIHTADILPIYVMRTTAVFFLITTFLENATRMNHNLVCHWTILLCTYSIAYCHLHCN